MATGRTTCAYIDELYYKYIEYEDDIPVININKQNIYNRLKKLIENSETLLYRGKQSRKFVEQYHDAGKVTDKLIDIYKSKVWK